MHVRACARILVLAPAALLAACGGPGGTAAMRNDAPRQAWIRMIGLAEARGPVKRMYDSMTAKGGNRPAVYDTPSGEPANIIRAHSLDFEGMRLAFSMSAAVHWSPRALPWVQREMINTVTSGANNCFY